MKKKYTIAGILVFLLVFSFSLTNLRDIRSNEMTQSEAPNVSQIENISTESQDQDQLTMMSVSSFTTNYNNVNKLVEKSSVIVEGELISYEYFDFNTNTFTKEKIKVQKSFTNSAKDGDILTFVENGGITTLDKIYNYIGNKVNLQIENNKQVDPKDVKVKILSNGFPLLKLHDNVLLFGIEDKEDFFHLSEKYYDVIGAQQGRFILNGDNFERVSSLGDITPIKTTRNDMEKQIKASIINNN